MKRWRILTVGSTDIYMHAATILYWLYAGITGHGRLMLAASVSVFIHETAHAIVATGLHHPPDTLELTPLGALLRLDEERRIPCQKQFLILLAGPCATLMLCGIAYHLTSAGILSPAFGNLVFTSNLSILLINLLPVIPLDGGRIIAMLIYQVLPVRTAGIILRVIGDVVGVGLIVLNILISCCYGGWNLSLAFAGCCIMYSSNVSTASRTLTELRIFIDRKIMLERKGFVECKRICALDSTSVRKLLLHLPPAQLTEFICIEAGTMREVGRISEHDLIQCYLSAPTLTLKAALSHNNP